MEKDNTVARFRMELGQERAARDEEMERCVSLNNKLWIDEHVCMHCKVWMSGHGLI